jgi:hypothetical protein
MAPQPDVQVTATGGGLGVAPKANRAFQGAPPPLKQPGTTQA